VFRSLPETGDAGIDQASPMLNDLVRADVEPENILRIQGASEDSLPSPPSKLRPHQDRARRRDRAPQEKCVLIAKERDTRRLSLNRQHLADVGLLVQDPT
jgi:hypothetical protein